MIHIIFTIIGGILGYIGFNVFQGANVYVWTLIGAFIGLCISFGNGDAIDLIGFD